MPRRARYLVPRGLPRRDEILAGCLVLVIMLHVVFAQLTIVLAVAFYLLTRLTRWRLSWLAVPAAAGLAWTAAGPRAALAGFTAGAARITGYLGAGGHQAGHLMHFTAAFAGIPGWLPRQLPLALVAGAAEAVLAGWLDWLHTDEQDQRPSRPGLIAAARRVAAIRAIRGGRAVARDGGCLGVTAGTGTRITLSWAEAAGGVAVCGPAAPDLLTSGFHLVHAAVRQRQPVLAIDHTADPALAARLAGQLTAACAAARVPLLIFGAAHPDDAAAATVPHACYEPFRRGSPGQRAALVADMLSWEGPGRPYRRSCVSYLDDVFELLDAAPGDPRVPVLDDVIHLLNPVALRARMEYVPAGHPRRDVLAERVRVSASLVSAEPATIAGLSRQLRDLRESPFGRWLRPSPDGPAADIDLGRAADGAVVLFRLGGQAPAASSAVLTRLIGQDLLAAAPAGNDASAGGLIWLAECAGVPRQLVTDLIARGRAVLAATTSAAAGAELTGLVNVVVTLRDGGFRLAVQEPPRLVPDGRLVRARVPRVKRDAAAAPRRAWEGA